MAITINGTTGIAGVDGSAGTPVVQGADTNTGIFFPAADQVAITTGGTQRAVVDASGNVGIGTTAPKMKLNAEGTYGNPVTSGATPTGIARLSQTTNNVTLDFGVTTGNRVWMQGADKADLSFTYDIVINPNGGNLLVGTTSVPSTGAGTNSTIVSNKDYSASFAQIINSTSTSGTQSFIQFGRGSSECGKITSTATNSTTYATSSDYRLKENISPMTGALVRVAALKPVSYRWKSDGTESEGFIAHELAEVVPQAVVGEKDALYEDGTINPQGIDTSFLVATLTAAIQEQQALIQQLQADVAALKGTP